MAEWPQQSFGELKWFTSQPGCSARGTVICNQTEVLFLVQYSRRGRKTEQMAAGTPTANWQVASAANWTLISLTHTQASALGTSVSGNSFFGVLFLKKASSLSSPVCPDLHQPRLSLDNEHCSALMAVEPERPANQVLPPVATQS